MNEQPRVVVALPLPPRECWPNGTGPLRSRMRAKREAREWATYATLAAVQDAGDLGLPWRTVTARAAFTFAVRRTRDDDGLTGALKQYRDAIAAVICGGDDAGWVWAGPPTVVIGPMTGVAITVTPRDDGEG